MSLLIIARHSTCGGRLADRIRRMSMVRRLRRPWISSRSLLALAMVGFLLRAMVPAGFMPGSHDGHGGLFALMLCNPAGQQMSVVVDFGVAHAGHHGGHEGVESVAMPDMGHDLGPDSNHDAGNDDDQTSMQGCPFCIVAAQAMLPTADVRILLASVAASTLPIAVYVGHSPISAQGPPLGSRAPPSHLG
jgi:hypothetical protein